MMEVKHTAAAQMEYMPTRDELIEKDSEFNQNVKNCHLVPNGVSHSISDLHGMEIDLIAEDDEVQVKSEPDDVMYSSSNSTQVTGNSKARSSPDELDTLITKEDCVDSPLDGRQKFEDKDPSDDYVETEHVIEEDNEVVQNHGEDNQMETVSEDLEEEKNFSKGLLKEITIEPMSKEDELDVMDVDPDETDNCDVIVCLDSPMQQEEELETDSKVELEKEQQVVPSVDENVAKPSSLPTTDDLKEPDNESIFVIDDDDEEIPTEIEKSKNEQAPTNEVASKDELKKSTEEEVKSNKNLDPKPTEASTTDAVKSVPVDDIVILDDDEEVESIPPESEKKNEVIQSTACDKTQPPTPSDKPESKIVGNTYSKESNVNQLVADNSDNARDGTEEKDQDTEENSVQEPASITIESNGESNTESLLKESENQNKEDHNEPPVKRKRMSRDDSNSRTSNTSNEDDKSSVTADASAETAKGGNDFKRFKRSRSSESRSSDTKRPKTLKADEEDSEVNEKKTAIKLYPQPKINKSPGDLNLDFLKRFKKSIHKMTKSDLEELVLQKIVEAIVHKSEFSEMRELIAKQEKLIVVHRAKINELNKQFRDLEMVHNRVLKDLETKNSQFIMPVKITRAVGLQVSFPSKKHDQPVNPPTNSSTTTHVLRSSTVNTRTSPDKQKPVAAVASPSTATAATPSTTTTTTTATTPAPSSTNVNIQKQQLAQRRGCTQKLTPLRPDTPRAVPLTRGPTPALAQPVNTSPSTPKEVPPQTKVLPAPVRAPVTRSRLNSPGVSSSATVTPIQTPANPVNTPVTREKAKVTPVPSGVAPKKILPKPTPPEPEAVAKTTSMATNTNVSTLKIPPTSESFIDLTEEDDPPPTTPQSSAASSKPESGILNITPPTGTAYLTRSTYKAFSQQQQPAQQAPKPAPPKPTPSPKPAPPKPQTPARPPVQIPTRVNGTIIRPVLPPSSRFRHPAPLPNANNVQVSDPSWKLPPAQPTIRISNLDTGIVISWTIENPNKDKHADSVSYQIYAYQETSDPPSVDSWRHVGDVKAMLLPMAVTLTQFQEGQRYHFAVRAVDAHNRCGPYSHPKTWS